MRFMYEYGFMTNEIFETIFRKKRQEKNNEIEEKENKKTEQNEEIRKGREEEENNKNEHQERGGRIQKLRNPEQAYKHDIVRRMREVMRELIGHGFVEVNIIYDRGIIGKKKYVYFLTKKGYNLVRGTMLDLNRLSIDTFGANRHEIVVVPNLDNETFYKHYRMRSFKGEEMKHGEYLIKLKIAFSNVTSSRVILADLMDKVDPLYTKDRVDILVEREKDKFIAIEYEKSLKSKDMYVGYVKYNDGKKMSSPGFLRKKQDNPLFDKVIIICENDRIMKEIIRHINFMQTPDSTGNYKKIDKIYVTSKQGFTSIRDLFLKGECIYPRARGERGREDYQKYPFISLITA